MDILITGGTVFVSRAAAEYFAARGHRVSVLNRGNGVQPDNVTHIKADRHTLGDTLRDRHFDAVLDICAYSPDDVSDLLDALGGFGTYILISSSAVYPETLPQPFNEGQKCGENSIWGDYGVKKLAAEELLRSRTDDYYILRPPYLYGAGNNLYREAFMFECAERGQPVYLPKDGSMKLQFFHVRDLCRFMELLLAEKPAQRIFNTGNTSAVSVREWAELCYAAAGKTPEIRYVPESVPQRSYFPFYDYEYFLDVTAQSALMGGLTPLEEGLREAYDWWRSGGRDSVRKKPLLEYIDREINHI